MKKGFNKLDISQQKFISEMFDILKKRKAKETIKFVKNEKTKIN